MLLDFFVKVELYFSIGRVFFKFVLFLGYLMDIWYL